MLNSVPPPLFFFKNIFLKIKINKKRLVSQRALLRRETSCLFMNNVVNTTRCNFKPILYMYVPYINVSIEGVL